MRRVLTRGVRSQKCEGATAKFSDVDAMKRYLASEGHCTAPEAQC